MRPIDPDPLLQHLEEVGTDNDEDEDEDFESEGGSDDEGEGGGDGEGGAGDSENEDDEGGEDDNGDEGEVQGDIDDEGEGPDDSNDEDEEIQHFGSGDGVEGGDLIAIFGNERITKRTEPVVTLKTLWLWDLVGYPNEEVRAIFEKYPNIEQIHLPNICGTHDVDDLARTIVGLCPKLRTLQFYGEGRDTNIVFPFKVLEALPEHLIEQVCIRNFHIELDEQMARSVFLRHSATLHTLILQGCSPTDSEAIRTILAECGALEDLRFMGTHYSDYEAIWPYPDLYGKGCGILLADAIAVPWACTMIKHLSLLVRINELRVEPELRRPAYYRREAPVDLSPIETRYFEPLEHFYRQIGRLKELTHLDLRMDMMGPDGERQREIPTCAEVSFPGLLNIGMGRPGYLELLGGLSKLKQLCGSVLADTNETKLRVGAVEAFWMREHWPLLERAEFFYRESEVTQPFKWLRAEQKKRQIELGLVVHYEMTDGMIEREWAFPPP